LLQADPASPVLRARLHQLYADLGDDEVEIARLQSTPANQRISHWRSARAWFGRSKDISHSLAEQGTPVPPAYAVDAAWMEKQIALCDRALFAFEHR
jgi:hypothetical protein